MDFAFTDEQMMIRDTAESFLQEVSNSKAVRNAMLLDTGYDPSLWQTVCRDLYWQAIHTPEKHGGMGLGYVELVAMQEQMGRFLMCAPFFSSVCQAVNVLLVAANGAQQQQYLPLLCEGKTATLAFAGVTATRNGGQWGAEVIDARYKKNANGYQLNGCYRYVIDGVTSDYLLVAACDEEAPQRDHNVSLFILPGNTNGVSRENLPTMDQTRRQSEVVLNNVSVSAQQLIGEEGAGWPVLSIALDLAVIALAAEQVGGAQQALDMTVAYSKERQQFGRTIASFQAIKHKAADMMQRVEVARSGVYYAACVAQDSLAAIQLGHEFDRQGLAEAASVAKSYCSEAFFNNAADAIQIHGGVGFTWEYDVHLYFKRAKASEQYLGNAAYHRERLARLLLDEGVIL